MTSGLYRGSLLSAYLIVVFGLTLTPVPQTPDTPGMLDKVVHFVLFGGLAWLVHWNLLRTHSSRTLLAMMGAGAVAGLIELLQGPIPYRSADVWDFVAGTLGAVVMGGILGLRRGANEHTEPTARRRAVR
jgi:VanZ family protein